jgi:predicted nucleotidyltransferase
MSQYSWVTCPEPVLSQIGNLVATFQDILHDNLIGIYLHGSLAMGCFNPQRSDIDLLVVMRNGMSVETKRDVVQYLLKSSLWPAPIEISFLVQKDVQPFQHPLPFDLHYSESWREQYTRALADGPWRAWNDEKKHDNDLAAHITIMRARGICLDGEPILEVFPFVPPADYIASIVGDFNDANAERQRMPVYFTLNACRVLAYLREGHIYSKDESGVWALQTLPVELHGVVEQALEMYRGNQMDAPFDETALTQFAYYMGQNIHP